MACNVMAGKFNCHPTQEIKPSGCKAIAEKREGKNYKTIFSFERSGRDWGHRWKEGRKEERWKLQREKSLIGSVQFLFCLAA